MKTAGRNETDAAYAQYCVVLLCKLIAQKHKLGYLF